MVSTANRFIIKFAVHISEVHKRNYLAEIAEDMGATTTELSDGSVEIVEFRARRRPWILQALKQEQKRGGLVIIEEPASDTASPK